MNPSLDETKSSTHLYKALIIDDERPARQAVSALGKWAELGIDFPLEAAEGKTGLEIMKSHKPDIVLVDMRMPVMGGLEFIKAASAEFPNSKYVIISGYSDFEYARTAIKYNVADYLLKPVIEEELDNVLRQVVQGLDSERLSLQYNPVAHIARMLSADPESSRCGSIYYGIAAIYLVNQFREEKEKKFDFSHKASEISRLVLKCWDDRSSCLPTAENDRQLLLAVKVPAAAGDRVPSEDKLRADAAQQVEKLVEALRTDYGVYTIASVGSFHPKIEAVFESYRAAMELLNNINLLDNSRSVFTAAHTNDMPKWLSVLGKKELFTRAFDQKNLKSARDIVEQYFSSIKKHGYVSREDLIRITLEFMTVFREIAVEKGVMEVKRIIPQAGDRNIFSGCFKTEDFGGFIHSVFKALVESTSNPQTCSIHNIIIEIKEYIDNNYSEEISLTTFSSRYHMTREYLSKQFKEQFGLGIYEYVLKLRMTIAAKYLEDLNIKVQEVAQRVGYADNNYFSRAFKTFYGVSPKEYRSRN
ncbi:response regulator transcription factor [Ruminiclostridium cellobioparum]|uniref:Stage 0 sporulation protein A homolog n=1 Tax=Ruminiclostridium cellobioparum subsp. termitidis CT1112 TaxID=1195236 RepID=S0FS66_RUMCE|nr:helix-turn-helix domain-containing protein [Ruminiclostridium cellobioparum]EMS72029.1 two component transcriptional regulator, AraC family protein [Ruminiclostridium cellobioparum subsp. termitidis CT1112]